MQGWQLVAPGEFDEVPAAQGLHAALLLAPVSFEKVPARRTLELFTADDRWGEGRWGKGSRGRKRAG